jgi:hypothetical protein
VRRAATAVALAAVLVLAESALADEYNMRLNEIDPSAGVVELLDISRSDDGRGGHDPNGGVGTYGEAYVVRSYDGAGNDFAAQEYTRPLPFVGRAPFVFSLPLPPVAGQVCFERPRNPESTLLLEEYRFHCMGYGEVTKPVIRRLQLGRRRLPMPVAPVPPAGESVQRQRCGKAAVADSTRGAENVEVPAACAGEPTACDDPRHWDVTEPRLVVKLPRVNDVDRALVMKVTMNEPGDFTFRGSVSVGQAAPGRSFLFGPIRRELRPKVPVRIRIPISRQFKRMIKRAARRGVETHGGYVGIGRDNACFPNRYHSSRSFTVVP